MRPRGAWRSTVNRGRGVERLRLHNPRLGNVREIDPYFVQLVKHEHRERPRVLVKEALKVHGVE